VIGEIIESTDELSKAKAEMKQQKEEELNRVTVERDLSKSEAARYFNLQPIKAVHLLG
jgi:hypothetical protein